MEPDPPGRRHDVGAVIAPRGSRVVDIIACRLTVYAGIGAREVTGATAWRARRVFSIRGISGVDPKGGDPDDPSPPMLIGP